MAKFYDVPEGVLEEILSWLPPESLIRFKCVCKSWYALINALINDPTFVAKHLHNATGNTLTRSPTPCFWKLLSSSHPEPQGEYSCYVEGTHLLTMATRDFEVNNFIPCVTEDLQFLVRYLDDDHLKLVSLCDGLLCLHAYYNKEFICLLNPALKECKIVLNAGLGDGFRIVAVGFGYNSMANDYKVVIIKSAFSNNAGSYEAELYTRSTNSWKEIELGVEISHFTCSGNQSLYCNGVCYWYYLDRRCSKIVSFDVGDEVFHSIPPPDSVNRAPEKWKNLGDWSKIAVWNNSIVLFFYGKQGPAVIDMWVMDASSWGVESSCTWTKHLTIGPLLGIKRPLAFFDNNVLFLETKDCEVISCNIRKKRINDLAIRLINFRSERFVVYARSLVSILERERKSITAGTIGYGYGYGASSSERTMQNMRNI